MIVITGFTSGRCPTAVRGTARRGTRKRQAGVFRTPSVGCVALLSGEHAELGRRGDVQLDHQLRAIRLDGAKPNPEFIGNLLVQLAGDDAIEDLTLPGSKHGQARTLSMSLFTCRALCDVATKRALKCIQQRVTLERLL